MDVFISLLKESILVSGLMALALIGTACYLWATGQTVPQELYYILATVVAFYFGTKNGINTARLKGGEK